MNRRSVILAVTCAGVGALAGCTSSALPHKDYIEEVSSILITADEQHIAFVGTRYHYIFRAPAVLVAILGSPLRPLLVASFKPFVVYEQRRVYGSLSLTLIKNATAAQAQEVSNACERDKICRLHGISLVGERFLASDLKGATPEVLQRSYRVTIIEKSEDEYGHSSQASPIKKIAGGILLIGLIPLMLVTGMGLPCCASSGH